MIADSTEIPLQGHPYFFGQTYVALYGLLSTGSTRSFHFCE